MSVGKLPEGEMPSGERLPEWVNQIRGIFEKIKGNKKIFRKLTKYARDDLEIIEKSREKGSITELPTHQSTQGGRCGVSCPPRADAPPPISVEAIRPRRGKPWSLTILGRYSRLVAYK